MATYCLTHLRPSTGPGRRQRGANEFEQPSDAPVSTDNIDSRRRLCSGSSTALLVPVTRRCTLGDRAFSSRGCTSVEQSAYHTDFTVITATFGQQLKTFLFEQSLSWHPCYIALDTTFLCFNFFDIVTCPWSSLRTKCHVNLFHLVAPCYYRSSGKSLKNQMIK